MIPYLNENGKIISVGSTMGKRALDSCNFTMRNRYLDSRCDEKRL